MENNHYASVVAEVKNADTYLTADVGKTNEEDEDMKISDKEENKTVGYQETLKIYVNNIDKNIKTKWIPIHEVIDDTFSNK